MNSGRTVLFHNLLSEPKFCLHRNYNNYNTQLNQKCLVCGSFKHGWDQAETCILFQNLYQAEFG